MRQGQRPVTAAGKGFQCGKFPSGPRAALLPPCRLQNLFQCQNPRFGYQHSAFEKGARRLGAAAVVGDRNVLNVEVIAEGGNACRCPIRDGRFANASDDLRGLPHVVKTLAGLLVDVGRRLHPGRMPRHWRLVT